MYIVIMDKHEFCFSFVASCGLQCSWITFDLLDGLVIEILDSESYLTSAVVLFNFCIDSSCALNFILVQGIARDKVIVAIIVQLQKVGVHKAT